MPAPLKVVNQFDHASIQCLSVDYDPNFAAIQMFQNSEGCFANALIAQRENPQPGIPVGIYPYGRSP
jgi:hypothetical protein